tara:strand:+ start:5422 stop:6174 length:753 start_codon:yes stop_codon:yes gene_type:complete
MHNFVSQMKQYLPLIVLIALCAGQLKAQQYVEGIIVDQEENPLGFAHATNTDLNLGQVSNMNGKFNLLARKGDTITFSFVGFMKETLVVESVHLVNYLKVTLTEDSLLLPSITIYSDPYFKVPFNYQAESMDIGLAKSDKDPIKPGSLGPGESGGVGLTLYGPITAFSKDAKEQRKYGNALESSAETHYFDRYIENDTVKTQLCKIYDIDSSTYDRIIVSLNNQYPQIQTLNKPEEIWNWLLQHFHNVLN